MLSDEEKHSEIQRRAMAGSGAIPKTHEDETIVKAYGVAGSLYIFSQYAVYRMRTADEIDPDVTAKDVPWSIGQHLSLGTLNPLIHSSFGVFEELSGLVFDVKAKERITEILLEFAVSAAELNYAKQIYEQDLDEFEANWDSGKTKPKLDGSAIQLPRIDAFEISFSIFYASAKRAIGKLLAILEWSCGFETRYGTHLDKLLARIKRNKKLKHIHDLLPRLEGFSPAIKLLNELRNCFEHPSPKRSVHLKNVVLLPEGNILMPTWTLIHDELEMPENQDHGVHMTAVTDMISRLAEMVLMVSASAKQNNLIVWEAVPREDSEIQKDFPCRWKVNLLGFAVKNSPKT